MCDNNDNLCYVNVLKLIITCLIDALDLIKYNQTLYYMQQVDILHDKI